MCDSVLGELIVQLWEWIGFEAMLWAGEKGLARLGANEAISPYRLRCGGRFEQEGLFGAGTEECQLDFHSLADRRSYSAATFR